MPPLLYRPAAPADIPGMAEVRAGDWGSAAYWRERIAQYLSGEHNPRDGAPHPSRFGERPCPTRTALVCADGTVVVGLIAGHLTRRFGCDGELQWISVRPEYRGQGIASELLRRLAAWFVGQDPDPRGAIPATGPLFPSPAMHNRQPAAAFGSRRVCVDVEPANDVALRFYARHGAVDLKPHWMVWEDIGQLCDRERR